MSSIAEYRRLGKSGIRVSVPVLGCMSFGDVTWNDWVLAEEKALPILEAAWDAGINTLDTANMYSNGVSERISRRFISHFNIPRENLVIITKVRFLVDHEEMHNITTPPFFRPDMPNIRDYVNQGGLSRAAIFNQTQACLERLDTDYVDVMMIHTVDLETPFEETMRALHDLILSGKARYLGASNVRVWQFIEKNNIAERNGWTTFSCVQMEHSLLYCTEERELFAYCGYKGIGVLAYAPLMDGHLARSVGIQTTRTKKYASTFQEFTEKKSWKMSRIALAWLIDKNSIPIVGINSVERLNEAIVNGKALTVEEIKYLEEPYEDQPPRF